MFTRFTSPEGRGAWVRASGVRAITEQEDGSARLFLGYGLQTDVLETPEQVLIALEADALFGGDQERFAEDRREAA